MQEFIAFFVRDDRTGHLVHHEVFESTGMSPDELTAKISTRTDELNRQFGIAQHDVFWEGYDSLGSLRRSHPELDDAPYVRYFSVAGKPVQLERNAAGAVVTRALDPVTNRLELDAPGAAATAQVAGGTELTKERFDQLRGERVQEASYVRQAAPIAWTHTGDGEFPYRGEFEGNTYTLRVNDFPAEPLYTVMIGDHEVEHLNDWPKAWIRPGVPKALLDEVAAIQNKKST